MEISAEFVPFHSSCLLEDLGCPNLDVVSLTRVRKCITVYQQLKYKHRWVDTSKILGKITLYETGLMFCEAHQIKFNAAQLLQNITELLGGKVPQTHKIFVAETEDLKNPFMTEDLRIWALSKFLREGLKIGEENTDRCHTSLFWTNPQKEILWKISRHQV